METDHIRVAQKLESVFSGIQRDRMADVPILNPHLTVAAVGTQRCGADWLSILVTPWCMNIMLLPGAGELDAAAPAWPDWRLGDTVKRSLPGGVFGFICGEEAALGRYLMCSLFSPMQEFADQAGTVATAEAAAKELMTAAEPAAASQESRSRRAMFGLGGRSDEAQS